MGKTFGETIRELRVAQDLGLRETAVKIGISPAYLSRIEREKDNPPSPEIIQSLARHLAADPDVLFRLADSSDPEITLLLKERPAVMQLLRKLIALNLSDSEISDLTSQVSDSKHCV